MPEIFIRRKRSLWRHARLLAHYPVGILAAYPVGLLLLVWAYTGISPFRAVTPAESALLLPGLWLVTLFLCPLVIPFLLHLPEEHLLDPKTLAVALLKVLGFAAVSLLISVWVLRSESGGPLLALRFHAFLLAFQLLFVGGSLLLRGIGAGGALAQALTTAAGLAMILTVVFANTALAAAADAHKPLVIQVAVWANPVVVAARSFLEMDVFRIPPLYGFSRIADYPFLAPPWKSVAALYGALGIGMGVLGVCLRVVLFQVPRAVRSRRQRQAEERRRSQPEGAASPPPATDWESSPTESVAPSAEAPAAEAAPPSGEAVPPVPAADSRAEEADKMALGPLALEREPAAQGFVGEEAPKEEKKGGFLNWLDEKSAETAPKQPETAGGAAELRGAFEESDKDTKSRRPRTRAILGGGPPATPPEAAPPAEARAEPAPPGEAQAPQPPAPRPETAPPSEARTEPPSPAEARAPEPPATAGALSWLDSAAAGPTPGAPPARAEPAAPQPEEPPPPPEPAAPEPAAPAPGLVSEPPAPPAAPSWLDAAAAPEPAAPAPVPAAEPPAPPAAPSWLDAAAAGPIPQAAPTPEAEPPAPAPAEPAAPEPAEPAPPPATAGPERRRTTIRFLKIPKPKTGVVSGATAPSPSPPDPGPEDAAPPASPESPEAPKTAPSEKSVFGDLMAGWGEPAPKAKAKDENPESRKAPPSTRFFKLDLDDADKDSKPGEDPQGGG